MTITVLNVLTGIAVA